MKDLKLYGQKILKWLGLYERLKASAIYDFYWQIADPSIIINRRKEIDFYRILFGRFLRPEELIFDVGANKGTKTEIFLELGAKVISIEPDECNQEILRQRFLRYRMSKKSMIIIGKAVGDKISTQKMWIEEPGSAKNTLSHKWVEVLRNDDRRFGTKHEFGREIEVDTVTLDHLIETIGLPYYIKIDVEGYEPYVISGLHHMVPFLSFEINLPEFIIEGFRCINLLEKIDGDGKFNYVINCYDGLVLNEWLNKRQFENILESCKAPSIEVFWKTHHIDAWRPE